MSEVHTLTTPKTDEQKREALRARIEAAQQRNSERTLAEQARQAADEAIAFTRKHPLAVVGGVIFAGFAIGAMTKSGRKVGKRGSVLVNLALESAFAYGARMLQEALVTARDAGDRLEDIGDSAATTARGLRRDAAYKFDVATDAVRAKSRKVARKGSRAVRSLKERTGR
ncbi:hypothetical protein [Erythrobacter mangrovi]|uniref:Uncharacterized protein n=1 Tax=Erythrobacter mangrovi TaxID=2739433 RepID=A0A7D4BVJ6_9SPHN|nr:hypothetical protein [Erythrobacter mangrovi]QKG71507.1 hypothetical protein HQR01_09110 [Erythrobacter mangrovi]